MHASPQKVEETATRIFDNAKNKPNCSSDFHRNISQFKNWTIEKDLEIYFGTSI